MYPRLLVSLANDPVFEVFESHRLAAEFDIAIPEKSKDVPD
jgi:hypothetical protein